MALKTVVFCAAVTVAVVLGATRVETQSGFQDVVPALLTEVRALRTTIATVAAAGATGQLVLGRLQMQEARVIAAAVRLEATRERMSQAQRAAGDLGQQISELEAALNAPLGSRSSFYDLDMAELPNLLKARRRELAESATEMQQLTAIEAVQASELAAEQARWTELNQRLDDIERLLARKD
jgi:chromosome segregation ATPase